MTLLNRTLKPGRGFVTLGALLLLSGCTTIKSDVVCPAGTIGTSWSSQDSNIAGTLVSAGLSAASAAGFMEGLKTAPPKASEITVSSSYPWGFGSNSGASGCVIPSTPPTTTVNNAPGGTINIGK